MEHLPRLTLVDAISLHALDISARGLSPRTLDVYKRNLARLVAFTGDVALDALTPALLRRFQVDLTRQEVSSVYQHQIMRCLRAFLNFCVAEGLLERTPMINVKMPKVEQRVKEALTNDQLAAVLKTCDNLRDRALVLVLVSSGLRAAEACALQIADADIPNGMLVVRKGKGGKGRMAHIDTQARRALKHYLLTRKAAPPTAPLLASLTNRDQPLTPHAIAQVFKKLSTRSGVAATAHGLRRTFALRALRAGMNIYALALLMGHSDIGVLRHYLPLVEADLDAAYKQAFGG